MSIFKFKHFQVKQSQSAMKVGTDAMVLGAMINAESVSNALDIGTGTGVLSLMIAQNCIGAKITAVEVDELSADEARDNFHNSSWSERLTLKMGDFLKLDFTEKFELIFSNPPYFQTTNLNHDSRKSQARHASYLPPSSFFERCTPILSERGGIWIIVPKSDQSSWVDEARRNNLYLRFECSMFGKPQTTANRVILTFSHKDGECVSENLIIRNQDGSYSEEYIQLTREFHGIEL